MKHASAHNTAAIPWQTAKKWCQIQAALKHTVAQYQGALGQALATAADIRTLLTDIFPMMTLAGQAHCRNCMDPCCVRAYVYYDFCDLLYFTLADIAAPAGQPRSDRRQTCRYLQKSGCMLNREQRPWICTWYLCPPQKQWFIEQGPMGEVILQKIKKVQALRKQMEAVFMATQKP